MRVFMIKKLLVFYTRTTLAIYIFQKIAFFVKYPHFFASNNIEALLEEW